MEKETKDKILKIIQNSSRGMTISQIKEELGYSRETVTLYVEVLLALGLVETYKFGNVRVFVHKKVNKND
jgi:predicted transcriptional regulator